MEFSEILNFVYVALLSIVLLYINNKYNKNLTSIQTFNFLVLSESIVLTFFFEKFPSFLSIFICLSSIYFILSHNNKNNSLFSYSELNTFLPEKFVSNFKYLGFILIICIVIYEYFADGTFSESDLLVLSLSFLLIFYDRIPEEYKNERDFFLLFLFILAILFVFPTVLYKIKYGYVGIKTEGFWYDSQALTFYFLSKPLYFVLSFLFSIER